MIAHWVLSIIHLNPCLVNLQLAIKISFHHSAWCVLKVPCNLNTRKKVFSNVAHSQDRELHQKLSCGLSAPRKEHFIRSSPVVSQLPGQRTASEALLWSLSSQDRALHQKLSCGLSAPRTEHCIRSSLVVSQLPGQSTASEALLWSDQ